MAASPSSGKWRTRFKLEYQSELWADEGSNGAEMYLGHSRIVLWMWPEMVFRYRTYLWNGQQQGDVFRNTGSGLERITWVWSYGSISQGLDDPALRVRMSMAMAWQILSGPPIAHNDTWTYGKTMEWLEWFSETWINNANIDRASAKTLIPQLSMSMVDGLADIVRSLTAARVDQWKYS